MKLSSPRADHRQFRIHIPDIDNRRRLLLPLQSDQGVEI
jgi:hypothetical protein